jgi:hypothetical protein
VSANRFPANPCLTLNRRAHKASVSCERMVM